MQVAGIAGKTVTMTDLVYKFGPRINAAGRIKSGAEAVRLLITDDAEAALRFAQDIDSYNQDRRDYDSKTTDEALEQLQKDPMNSSKFTTVVFSPNWHKGVVGIAASRLTETFYRPTIVLTAGDDDIISGSARSVSDFDIYTAIDSCRDLLTNFGGHKAPVRRICRHAHQTRTASTDSGHRSRSGTLGDELEDVQDPPVPRTFRSRQ